MKIIYSKFSNDRCDEFNIRTDILLDENGNKYIDKSPVSYEGNLHITALYKAEAGLKEVYKDTPFVPNKIVNVEGRDLFEFVEGKNFENELDDLLHEGKTDELEEKLIAYMETVLKAHNDIDFEVTDKFREIFGDVPMELPCIQNAKSAKITDIDMVPANIIGNTIIDYEWTFTFPIPANFVIYRIIHYYMEGAAERHVLRDRDLYKKMGITAPEILVFQDMEANFQKYITKDHEPLWKLHESLVQPEYIISDMVRSDTFAGSVVIDGNETDSLRGIPDEKGDLEFEISIPGNAKEIKIRLGDRGCIVFLKSLRIYGGNKYYTPEFGSNAKTVVSDIYLFGAGEPHFTVEDIKDGYDSLKIKFSVVTDNDSSCIYNYLIKGGFVNGDRRDYDELEKHYIAAIELKNIAEYDRRALGKQASRMAAELDAIYRNPFYKATKPFRELYKTYKYITCGTAKKQIKKEMRKHSGEINDKKAYYEEAVVRKRREHVGEKFDRMCSAETIAKEREELKDSDIVISVLVPVYNTPEDFLREMIESVLSQSYDRLTLCIADGSDNKHKEVGRIIKSYMSVDDRIRYVRLTENKGISENTNAALDLAEGNYIALLDHDDILHPEAFYNVVKRINETGADFLYSDEAVFYDDDMERPVSYHLKPDFSPIFLRGINYICHLSVFSRKLLDKVGRFRKECDGSQDYDLILRLTSKANKVEHIAETLYFWRSHPGSVASDLSAKPYCIEAAKRALRDHLEEVGEKGEVTDSDFPSAYRIRYELSEKPHVTIVIPNKDHSEDLKLCLDSIFERSTYENFDVEIVENGSDEPATFEMYEEYKKKYEGRFSVITWTRGFNYAAINNYGVKEAKGEYVLLLNNDTEVITPEWIEEMLYLAVRKETGCVGALLYFGDDTVQHGGVIFGIGGSAGHSQKSVKRENNGYLARLSVAHEVGGNTGACLMISKAKYAEMGGLDEDFVVAFNDVDFCCRLTEKGYVNMFTPFAKLYHYESKSRGYEETPEKLERFNGERDLLRQRHEKLIVKGEDPYYNHHQTLDREDCTPREDYSVFL